MILTRPPRISKIRIILQIESRNAKTLHLNGDKEKYNFIIWKQTGPAIHSLALFALMVPKQIADISVCPSHTFPALRISWTFDLSSAELSAAALSHGGLNTSECFLVLPQLIQAVLQLVHQVLQLLMELSPAGVCLCTHMLWCLSV